jgi:hypothetical protein
VFVGIRKRGFIRRFAHPEMHQFAQAASQAMTDLPQRVGVCQLAEQHGHQLRPATKAFSPSFGIVFLHQWIMILGSQLIIKMATVSPYAISITYGPSSLWY